LELPEGVDLSECELSEEQLKTLKEVLNSNKDLFSKTLSEPGKAANVFHRIDTGNNPPVNRPPYRAGFKEKKIIEEQVKDMLEKGVIKESQSPWASPVVLVGKKDGSVRFCVDYGKLNKITKRDVYPLPRIDDSLNSLGKSKYFSTLDLTSGYWQIPMALEDMEKTAFISHCGLFEFKVMPFGLTNAPATFQRYMDAAFAGLKWICCLIYLDDVIIFSKDFVEHIEHLKQVFERIRQANLKIKGTKCTFFKTELVYLGHLISAEGIRPDPAKIRAINKIGSPKNKSD
jgi:hypothetical protein